MQRKPELTGHDGVHRVCARMRVWPMNAEASGRMGRTKGKGKREGGKCVFSLAKLRAWTKNARRCEGGSREGCALLLHPSHHHHLPSSRFWAFFGKAVGRTRPTASERGRRRRPGVERCHNSPLALAPALPLLSRTQ